MIMGATYVKLVPEDRCLLQDIKKKLCELETGQFSGELLVDGAPVSESNPLPVETPPSSGGLTDVELRATPVPISGTISVTGVATSALQGTGNTSLANIDSKTPSLVSGRQPVDGSGVTQPVSAVSLPLPTGASTSVLQGTGNTSLSSIDTKTPALVTGRVPVDGSGVIQPISGVVTANAGTNLNTSALALETGGNLTTIATNRLVSAINTNSTITALGIGGVFTGTAEDVTQFNVLSVSVFSDFASAIDGLSIQQSTNGTNWDIIDVYTTPANTGKVFSIPIDAKFVRIVYTNGGTAQGVFRLQTIYNKSGIKDSSVRPQDARSNDNDMSENLAYQMSYDPLNNVWNRVQTQDLYITGQAGQITVGQNILLAVGGTGVTDTISYRSIAFQIIPTGSVISGVVTFEASNDPTFATANTVSLWVYDDNNQTANPVTSITPATGVTRSLSGPLKYRYARARISTVIAGGGSLQAITTLRQMTYQPHVYTVTQASASTLNVTAALASITSSVVPGVAATNLGKAEDAPHVSGDTGVAIWGVRQDSQTVTNSANGDYSIISVDQYGNSLVRTYGTIRKTYSVSFTFTPAVTATDSVEITGSSASIQITKIIIGGIATAAAALQASLIRRSTLDTGGTSTNQTIVNHETGDGASTATIKLYSVNPSALGTTIGSIRSVRIPLGTATDPRTPITYTFGSDSKPFILAGATQTLCLNFAGGAISAGASIDFTIEYTEI